MPHSMEKNDHKSPHGTKVNQTIQNEYVTSRTKNFTVASINLILAIISPQSIS